MARLILGVPDLNAKSTEFMSPIGHPVIAFSRSYDVYLLIFSNHGISI